MNLSFYNNFQNARHFVTKIYTARHFYSSSAGIPLSRESPNSNYHSCYLTIRMCRRLITTPPRPMTPQSCQANQTLIILMWCALYYLYGQSDEATPNDSSHLHLDIIFGEHELYSTHNNGWKSQPIQIDGFISHQPLYTMMCPHIHQPPKQRSF